MAQWTKMPLFGHPQGYAAALSEAFRTVSPLDFSHFWAKGIDTPFTLIPQQRDDREVCAPYSEHDQ